MRRMENGYVSHMEFSITTVVRLEKGRRWEETVKLPLLSEN